MQKDFKITAGRVRVVGYQSNVEIYFWRNWNNTEADNSWVLFMDDCIEYTTKENIDYFIENFEYAAKLFPEDIKKLEFELYSYIKPMSADR